MIRRYPSSLYHHPQEGRPWWVDEKMNKLPIGTFWRGVNRYPFLVVAHDNRKYPDTYIMDTDFQPQLRAAAAKMGFMSDEYKPIQPQRLFFDYPNLSRARISTIRETLLEYYHLNDNPEIAIQMVMTIDSLNKMLGDLSNGK